MAKPPTSVKIIGEGGDFKSWLLRQLGVTGGGLLGAIIHLIIAAIVLMISDRFVTGMRVAGFTGALIAAIAIGVVGWLTSFIVAAIV